MDAEAQPAAGSSVPSERRWFWTSIIWKLTLFVGVVIAINTGLLIGAAYYTTSAILQDQIHDRLTTVAGDRQEMLVHGLKQQEDRAARFAGRPRDPNAPGRSGRRDAAGSTSSRRRPRRSSRTSGRT